MARTHSGKRDASIKKETATADDNAGGSTEAESTVVRSDAAEPNETSSDVISDFDDAESSSIGEAAMTGDNTGANEDDTSGPGDASLERNEPTMEAAYLGMPKPLLVPIGIVLIALALALVSHVCISIYVLAARPTVLDQLKFIAENTQLNFTDKENVSALSRVISEANDREASVQMRLTMISCGILSATVLIITGITLIDNVMAVHRGANGFWGVPIERRNLFVPGVLLALAGATLMTSTTMSRINIPLPLKNDGISDYLGGSDTDSIMREIENERKRREGTN